MRGYLKAVGIAVFVLAFFLQAVTMQGSGAGSGTGAGPGSGPGSGPMAGWFCAWIALMAVGAHFKTGVQGLEAQNVLLALSGLVNPLVLIYLGFSFSERFARLRLGLAIAIAACLASTWVFFCLAKFLPREGHFLWVLGIALIVASEMVRRRAPAQ
jgi:hypothetical protein